jgi:hypothetical protein
LLTGLATGEICSVGLSPPTTALAAALAVVLLFGKKKSEIGVEILNGYYIALLQSSTCSRITLANTLDRLVRAVPCG